MTTTRNVRITSANLAAELEKRTRKTPTCWQWVGNINHGGYGVIEVNNKCQRAHRLVLRLSGIEVPDGMMVDHLCRNRACVNPAHLRVVDARTNTVENSLSPSALNAVKTHCKNGHEFTPENTYIRRDRGGTRDCLTCKRAAKQRFEERRAVTSMRVAGAR